MVLQRRRDNRCDAVFSGTAMAAGKLLARVTRQGKSLRGYENLRVGRAADGVLHGRLKGLPAGGPYHIALCIVDAAGRVLDSLTVRDVLVGDVWILAGQSNMEGIGRLTDRARPHRLVRAFYMDDRWAVAEDPIHNLGRATDPVHRELNGGAPVARAPIVGTGPGVAFARELLRRTGLPQGVIACAHGGTSMAQWSPDLKERGGHSLYGALLRRFQRNGGRVAGVIWYQGCSDANAQAAPLYLDRMRALVAALRRDLNDTRLPFVAVQIGRYTGPVFPRKEWNQIQEQQRHLPEVIRHCLVAPVVDLALDDQIHISGFDQQRLGRRLARAVGALRRERWAGPPPMALRAIRLVQEANTLYKTVIVAFDHVVGRLRASGRPSGFTLGNPDDCRAIYRIDLDGCTARIKTNLMNEDPRTLSLYYGYGADPYCNITDDADRSLPVFGPVPIAQAPGFTAFARTLRVSRACPGAGNLSALAYPSDLGPLGLQPRAFSADFCDLHADLFAGAPTDVTAYFACALACPETMRLRVCLGYDGPIKLWLDGRLAFHDPHGTNPARPDSARVPFEAAAGKHELLIALGSNNGKAWGLFLRFQRLGVRFAPPGALSPTSRPLPQIEG